MMSRRHACLLGGALLLALAGCPRKVKYKTLESGSYVAEGTRPVPMRLELDLAHDRLVVIDGDARVELTLTRVTDREAWLGDCGTMGSYAKLELAKLTPSTPEPHGERPLYEHIAADCGGSGVMLLGPLDGPRLRFRRAP